MLGILWQQQYRIDGQFIAEQFECGRTLRRFDWPNFYRAIRRTAYDAMAIDGEAYFVHKWRVSLEFF